MADGRQCSLEIFCGKGGVGKTTLAVSVALQGALAGQKVLIVSSHPIPEMALAVSLDGLDDLEGAPAKNLFIVHIEPRKLLRNRVRVQFPSEALARTVVTSRIYESIVEIAPGIKEIAFLARMRELVEGEDGESPLYDRVIWDTPATGHFLEVLRVSEEFGEYLSGPFAAEGESLRRFLSEISMRIFPVTTLEEMAVEETVELCAELSKRNSLNPTAIYCNQVAPPVMLPAERFAEVVNGLRQSPPGTDLQFVADRCLFQRAQLEALSRLVETQFFVVPHIGRVDPDLSFLMNVIQYLPEVTN